MFALRSAVTVRRNIAAVSVAAARAQSANCRHHFPFATSASCSDIANAGHRSMAAPTEPGLFSVAYVTTPDHNSAKRLAHGLLERKLAACVNIVPGCTSIYVWEGKVNEDAEVLMMIKTRTDRVTELARYVRENHSYSVAEVIAMPITDGNPPYLDWLARSVDPVPTRDVQQPPAP